MTLIKFLLNGKEINLTSDNTVIKSNNFNIDKNGNMSCNNGNFSGDVNINNGDALTIKDSNNNKLTVVDYGGLRFFDSNGQQSNTISRTTIGTQEGISLKTSHNNSHISIANQNKSKLTYYSDTDKIEILCPLDMYEDIDMNSYAIKNIKDPTIQLFVNSNEYYWGYPVIGYQGEHKYYMHWTGSQLQFYVDGTYVGILSDERLKKDIDDIDDNLIKAIEEIEIKQFRIINRDGLISLGILAQDLIEIFNKYNIPAESYEILGTVKYKMEDNNNYYTINYEQFLVLKQLATDKKIDKQQKKIKQLEEKDKKKDKIIQELIERIEVLEKEKTNGNS